MLLQNDICLHLKLGLTNLQNLGYRMEEKKVSDVKKKSFKVNVIIH